jgi:hypothetical protein
METEAAAGQRSGAVEGVSHYGMSCQSELGAYLVGDAGLYFDLQQRVRPNAGEGTEAGLGV